MSTIEERLARLKARRSGVAADAATDERGGKTYEKISIECEGSPEAIQTLMNLLGAIEYNTAVGHSCVLGAFFDGDGADSLKFKGLPENHGRDMAEACGNYGDDFLALIGPNSATVYNAQYTGEEGDQLVKRKSVWPEPKDDQTAITAFISRVKGSE